MKTILLTLLGLPVVLSGMYCIAAYPRLVGIVALIAVMVVFSAILSYLIGEQLYEIYKVIKED